MSTTVQITDDKVSRLTAVKASSPVAGAQELGGLYCDPLKKKERKDLHYPDNHNGVVTHLEPDILECEVKWAFGSITVSKASGGGGILVELFQILEEDPVKVPYSICQQIWKTQQWP